MKNQKQIRTAFWDFLKEVNPVLASKKRSNKTQNDYCTDIQCMFIDYVENLRRNGDISEKMAYKVTL